MEPVFSARPAWAEVNLDSIDHNIRQFKALIGHRSEVMAVVKADAYGHGAATVAETAITAGASRLAVAFAEEGAELRRAGVKVPILVFGFSEPALFPVLVENRLTPTIFSIDTAREMSRLAAEKKVTLPVHLKIDTGMGRLGLLPDEAVDAAARIERLPGLAIEGVYTHFAAADEADRSYTENQILIYDRLIRRCSEQGITIQQLHAANSAAAIAYPGARLDYIRLGISLYGCYPSPYLKGRGVELIPALTLKSRVVQVKKVAPATAISYGCTYRTRDEALIATVSAGYADGYSRLLSNRGEILVRGQRAPVVGRVCMDYFMIDVSAVPGVRPGDEAVLYGRQGSEQVTVDEAAEKVGTISYELLCAVGKRLPRLYFRRGNLVSIRDFTGSAIL